MAKKRHASVGKEIAEMAEQSLRTSQELLPLAPDLSEQEEYVEEPLFEGGDGTGPASDPEEDEELTGDPDADGGSADGNPNPPQSS